MLVKRAPCSPEPDKTGHAGPEKGGGQSDSPLRGGPWSPPQPRDGGYHHALTAKVSPKRRYPERRGHCLGLASLGETTNIDRLDERQRVENDTLCRNRHGGLALDAVQSRASSGARASPQDDLPQAANMCQARVGPHV